MSRVNAWTTTPVAAADHSREQTPAMRRRLDQPPAERWLQWAENTGLAGVGEWPQLAGRLDELHHAGADTALLARRLARVPASVVVATLAQHRPGGGVKVDWRPWAEAVNPGLLSAEGWGSVQSDLTRLQAAGTDLNRLARRLAGRAPEKVAVGLRNLLRNHSIHTCVEPSGHHEMVLRQLRKGVSRDGSRNV